MKLTAHEARVLGSLIEKEATTPETYPLSLNALVLACNQKTNRDPVMTLDEHDVSRALDGLRQAGLALRSAEGGRVAKFAHNAAAKLSLDGEELAVLCVLLLRGPQTPGELRARTERLHAFAEVTEIEAVLERLMEGDPPAVARLERLPGRKEFRYVQLLGGTPSPDAHVSPAVEVTEPAPAESGDRVARLEDEVAALRAEVAALREELRDLKAQLG